MTLYECKVTDCWEAWQHSLHRTIAGAYKSGRKWMLKKHMDSFDSRAMIGKTSGDFMTDNHSFRVLSVKVED